MLGLLSKEPLTLTELAAKLGVSKSTASYHLSSLLGRGAIETLDSEPGRGGIVQKRYGLKSGYVVLVPTRGEEDKELARIREIYDLEILSWRKSKLTVDGAGLRALLYKMFLHLFRITRVRHREIMVEYGIRTGELISTEISRGLVREVLLNFVMWSKDVGVADADLIEVQSPTASIMVSSSCLVSDSHPSNSCYFLEGMLRGVARQRAVGGATVARLDMVGLPSCSLAVGRGRWLDVKGISEAMLTSSRFSTLRRGSGSK